MWQWKIRPQSLAVGSYELTEKQAFGIYVEAEVASDSIFLAWFASDKPSEARCTGFVLRRKRMRKMTLRWLIMGAIACSILVALPAVAAAHRIAGGEIEVFCGGPAAIGATTDLFRYDLDCPREVSIGITKMSGIGRVSLYVRREDGLDEEGKTSYKDLSITGEVWANQSYFATFTLKKGDVLFYECLGDHTEKCMFTWEVNGF